MKIERKVLLDAVEAVLPGVAVVEDAEQTSCIAFKDNRLYTFNDEVSCSIELETDITGAVRAQPLVALLRNIKDENVKIEVDGGSFKVIGKNKRASVTMEEEIVLPFETVKPPKRYHALPKDFIKAVQMVISCAGKDESQFVLTCVHVNPKFIEAMDNFQLSRYKIETGIKKPILIRNASFQSVAALKVIEFGETKEWVHFRNEAGVLISCRRYADKYPDMAPLLRVKGVKTKLPSDLQEAIHAAEVFASDNEESDMIQVTLSKNKIKLTGEGRYGSYTQTKKTKYTGKDLAFKIPPRLLEKLVTKHQHNCILKKDRLKIKVGKLSYVTVLSVV